MASGSPTSPGFIVNFVRKAKIPLFTFGPTNENLTRRVLRVKEKTDRRIILEVQRFGRKTPGKPGIYSQGFPTFSRPHYTRTISGHPAENSCRIVSRCHD